MCSAMTRSPRTVPPSAAYECVEAVVRLDRVAAGEVAGEAAELGFLREPDRFVPETEEYLGSTVVVLRTP